MARRECQRRVGAAGRVGGRVETAAPSDAGRRKREAGKNAETGSRRNKMAGDFDRVEYRT